MKVSVNLFGTPALTPAEFAKAPRRTNIGTSLTVAAPAGQYYPGKLINIGTNRWAFKPEVGLSHPIGRWTLDLAGGVWLFTANDRFYQGDSTRAQDPLFVVQGHASYNVTRRAWAAVDATWYGGADVRVDGGPPSARQNNARLGATLALPVGTRQSLKFAYSTGASVRTGADFTDPGGRVAVPVVRSDLTQSALEQIRLYVVSAFPPPPKGSARRAESARHARRRQAHPSPSC